MRILSYNDLTPSIPDITPRESIAQVGQFLPRTTPPVVAADSPGDTIGTGARLYACIRQRGPAAAALCSPRLDPKNPPPHFLIARDFSPRLECHGASTVVLDVGGLGRLLGDAPAIAAELERAAAGYSANVQIAMARTQTAARLLATAGCGLTVATGDVAAAVAPLPLDTLQVMLDEDDAGVGSAAARAHVTRDRLDTFRRWGLTMLGEIAALPAADLSQRMGQEGLALQQLARGIDRAPLVPHPGIPRFMQSMELEWPIDALEPLSFVLARLLDPVSSALERADRGAAALRLDLRLVDRSTHARVLQLPAAMRDAKVLRTLLLLDLESHPPAAAIDVVTLEIDPVPARIVQYSLLERAMPAPETLATLSARLAALVGEDRCGSPSLLDTWRPDGFEMKRFAATSSLRPGASSPRRPETLILRRFRPPIAIRVRVERGRPVQVAIDRRGMPGGAVEQAAGPWRASGAWWNPATAAWDRDEWDAALSDGSVCRLFHDRIADRWFLDGVLD